MSCNPVRLFTLTVVFVMVFCALTSAQESITYHIWYKEPFLLNKEPLPNNSVTEKYYLYLSRSETDPAIQRGLYQDVPTFNDYNGYYYGTDMQRKIILYNDDSTLLRQYFYLSYANVNVQSDTPGKTRTITVTDSPLFYVSNDSQLTLSNDLIITRKEESSYWNAGAVYLAGGTLNAEKASFLSSVNSYGNGGAITAYNNNTRNTINVDGAKFDDNKARYGGAIYSSQSDLFGNGATFNANSTDVDDYGYGGAIFLTNRSTAQLENASFTNNTATAFGYYGYYGDGGAIFSENSNLDVKGANFRLNQATGKGGAIGFSVSDGGSYSLQLGSFQGASSEFANNKQDYDSNSDTGIANSIAFWGGGNGSAHVGVDVEGVSNSFNMRDPMEVIGGSLYLVFTKTGEGDWNLYGNNDLSLAAGVSFNVEQGTFRLGNDAALNLATQSGNDQLHVGKKATLAIGDYGVLGSTVDISTNNFQTDTGSTLRLDNDLNLNVRRNQSVIGGSLTGTGNLIKNDNGGTLQFSGQTFNYSGDLLVKTGTFFADSKNSFATSGSVNFEKDTVLEFTANSSAANIVAQNITLGENVEIKISGIVGDSQKFTVLDSTTRINVANDDYDAFIINIPQNVDYLTTTFDFSNDYKQYNGTVALSWYEKNYKTFTIDSGEFKVDTILSDTLNQDQLTKDGLGTLELAQANTYSSDTVVNAGTLRLTNAQGTGTAGIARVASGAALELNFDGNYNQQITGKGNLLKTGADTVTLTNTANNYSGGTRITEGTLSIDNKNVLGTGDVTFAGGALQSKSSAGEVSISQNLVSEKENDIWLDTVTDMRITSDSTITGDGGIRKTGNGKLTLAGPAAYRGTTNIEQGTLSLASMSSIGAEKIVLSDGVTFENTAAIVNDRNITLNAAAIAKNTNGVIFDVEKNWEQTGLIDGNGQLVKDGNGTLTLSNDNSYSGGTRIKEGTLTFSSATNLGTGQIIFDGGTLKNTEVIENFSLSMTTENDHSILLETQKDMTVSSRLSGGNGLTKIGSGTLTLTGSSDYRGETSVKTGILKVDGELTHSKVTIESGAVLSGSGTIYNNVNFKSGAVYQWNYGLREEDSPYLEAKGAVNLRSAIFRPVTATAAVQDSYPDVIDGWTVLKYGMLEGNAGFASIDNETSPFYDFTFDYSTPNQVKVIGYHRRNPRQLSDSVAMGLVIPQRKVYRRAFEQIDREIQNGRYLGLRSVLERRNQQLRGQESSTAKHVWADFYGRTTEFESRYHTTDNWKFNSFGVQVGYSFLSTNWLSLGVTAGAEFPILKNHYDKIESSDGYIGLYAGTRIGGMWELKGYLGGGAQDYTSYRNDTVYTYRAKYRGDSFETNIELGRPILFGPILVRPHFGFDLEYAGQQGAVETKPSNEYRSYSNTSLTQLYFRIGIDTEKRTDWGEIFFGIDYANMIAGQSLPHVDVYYPTVKSGTTVYGTSLGQNIFSIRTGANQYLDKARSKSFFVNVIADIFADRAGGQFGATATFGFDSRF